MKNQSKLFRVVKNFLMLISYFFITQINSQTANNQIYYSGNGVLENVFDRYGNQYQLNDILINTQISSIQRTTQINCSNSIFNLYFEQGCGMDDINDPEDNARRAILCKVFEDVSNFIVTPLTSTNNKVNIWVRNINNLNVPINVLGVGSGYFSLPMSGTNGGIVDNEIWKTIHYGVDSYSNVAVPLVPNSPTTSTNGMFYHGMVSFNFNSINWHTDLSTLPTLGSGSYDLYTVVLHEVLHALGFHTLINQDGSFIFGNNFRYYSRYDKFLKNSDTSLNLIINPGATSVMYNYNFNTSLTATVLRPGCSLPNNTFDGNSNSTACNSALKYKSSITVPIYTPTCYEVGSSLSHFEDQHFPNCNSSPGNDNYFVMSNSTPTDLVKRYPTSFERTVLCDIGYTVNPIYGDNLTASGYSSYGGGSCSGITVSGINDGLNSNNTYAFTAYISGNLVIAGNSLLFNDINADRFEGLHDLLDPTALINGSNTTSAAGSGTTNVVFNSSVPGVHLLRYVPYNSITQQRGNITYVYVYVRNNQNCNTSSCNLVVNGDFESYSYLPNSTGQISYACGWDATNSASPDYFNAGAPQVNYGLSVPCNFIGFESSNNNNGSGYVGLAAWNSGGYQYSESIYSRLLAPLQANTTYQLSFDVSLAEGNSSFANKLQAYFSTSPIVVVGAGEIPILNPNMLFTSPYFSTVHDGWQTVTFTFTTTTGGEEYLYLGGLKDVEILSVPSAANIIGCSYNDYNSSSWAQNRGTYYYLDNVKLLATAGSNLNLPELICSPNTITDLGSYLVSANPGGVFSGPGVALVDGVYSFDSSDAGVGFHNIKYTYTSASNCVIDIIHTIEVSACTSDLQIIKSVDSLTPSVGSNITFTLTATNIGPSNATGVVVTDVIPSGYTFNSASPSTNWNTPNWTIGSLASGATTSMTITVTVNSAGNFTNRATITGEQFDPVIKNNSSSVTPKIIYAAEDNFSSSPISSCVGGNTNSVFNNDNINGYSFTATQVTVTLINNGGLAGVIINSSGVIVVPPGSALGTYNIKYRICQTANGFTQNCSEAIAIVIVANSVINANNDDFSSAQINTLTGGVTSSVFTNDTRNGFVVTSSDVNVAITSVVPNIAPSPTIDTLGQITLPQGVAIGTYTIGYTISDRTCSSILDTAYVTIVVSERTIVTPTIVQGLRANSIVALTDVQSNGKIIIGGMFSAYNNITCNNINRLNTNLTYDLSNPTFDVTGPLPIKYEPLDMKVVRNSGINYNKILLVGQFDSFNGGSNGKGIIRLLENGQPDLTFNSSYSGPNKGVSGVNSQARVIFVFPDSHPLAGKILVGGMFDKYNNSIANKLVLLNSDGSYDTGIFNVNVNTVTGPIFGGLPGFTSSPQAIGIQSDNKIVIGGYFNQFNGHNKLHILRLNVNGTLDSTFNSYSGSGAGLTCTPALVNGPVVQTILIEPNNKIILGGIFTHYNNTSRNNIVRLLDNGLIDTSFNVGTGFNNNVINSSTDTPGMVRAFAYEPFNQNLPQAPQGRLYVGGDFSAYKGIPVKTIVRLDLANGNNTNMNVGNGPNGTVWSLKRQGDGKIIVGGQFTTFADISAMNITRISQSGAQARGTIDSEEYFVEPEQNLFETTDESIQVYPNPSKGIFNLLFKNPKVKEVSLSVYNVLGQELSRRVVSTNEINKIDLSNLSKGDYFLIIFDKEKIHREHLVVN